MGKVEENHSLKKYNTFGLDVLARYFLQIKNLEILHQFHASIHAGIKPRVILGEGSNMLFTGNFKGIVLHNALRGIEIINENNDYVFIRAAGGENWDRFVAFCVKKNYGGLENLSLIPGSVGASPVQNIGAYGVEVKDAIERVETIDLENGEQILFSNPECDFTYRNSIFKREYRNRLVITHVVFRLHKKHRFITGYGTLEKELDKYPERTLQAIRSAVIDIRRCKLPDPDKLGNAGSFFKNPEISSEMAKTITQYYPKMPLWDIGNNRVKLSAAWLIEQCGWKGRKLRNVGTYKKQPLVIVNYGTATGNEILQLAGKIQKAVKNHFAIDLEPEVNII